MKLRVLLSLAVLALGLTACGSSSSSSSSAPATTASSASTPASSGGAGSGATVSATMKNLAFHPVAIHGKVGNTVKWTNDDGPPHNVTYVSGPKFTSSGTLNKGDTFSVKLTQPGTIHYFCSIHPFMKAIIVVTQ